MGARASTQHLRYTKVRVHEEDEEDGVCLSVKNEEPPTLLETPKHVLKTTKIPREIKERRELLRLELEDALFDVSSFNVLVIEVKYITRIQFEDVITTLSDANTRVKYSLIPVVVVDTLDTLEEGSDTNEIIRDMRKSLFYCVKKNIPSAVLLNNVFIPAMLSDICNAAYVKSTDFVSIASITSLPVLCNKDSMVKKIQTSNRLIGISGDSKPCLFTSQGNPSVFSVQNCECDRLYTHSSTMNHVLIQKIHNSEEMLAHLL